MLLFQGKKMVWPFSWSLSQKSGNLGLIFSTIFLLINNQLLFNVFPLFYPAATFEEGAKPFFSKVKVWTYWVTSNWKWKIFSNFVPFSECPNFTKGDLISESILTLVQLPTKSAKSHPRAVLLYVKSGSKTQFPVKLINWWRLEPKWKFSEIKPTLGFQIEFLKLHEKIDFE